MLMPALCRDASVSCPPVQAGRTPAILFSLPGNESRLVTVDAVEMTREVRPGRYTSAQHAEHTHASARHGLWICSCSGLACVRMLLHSWCTTGALVCCAGDWSWTLRRTAQGRTRSAILSWCAYAVAMWRAPFCSLSC